MTDYTDEDLRLALEWMDNPCPHALSPAGSHSECPRCWLAFRAEARREAHAEQITKEMAVANAVREEREACERVVEESLADCQCGNLDGDELLRRLRERDK
jgi:CheY-like chemotaxis protein